MNNNKNIKALACNDIIHICQLHCGKDFLEGRYRLNNKMYAASIYKKCKKINTFNDLYQ